jgi:hypothetical protein
MRRTVTIFVIPSRVYFRPAELNLTCKSGYWLYRSWKSHTLELAVFRSQSSWNGYIHRQDNG